MPELGLRLGNENTFIKYKQLVSGFDSNFKKVMFRALAHLERMADTNLAKGIFGVKARSGAAGLRGGFVQKVVGKSGKITASLINKKIYAAIQERGGKINISEQMSKFAWFKFYETGLVMWKAIALKKGQQITIPAHFYMRGTLMKEKNRILELIQDGIIRDLNK